ncbi:MAG: DNA adenine methylase, partial [Spirochaetia bacterium]|nr:DNA adenine methylase [Spirochaetia bacterium]
MKPALPYDPRFVENHLIAYIGNKRRLLPLILKALAEVESRGSQKISRDGVFIDFFSGTGVVSRLAKSLGFSVIANDWEDYSRVLNRTFIEGSAEDLALFENEGGLARVLEGLNALAAFNPEAAYVSEYYCPADDAKPDVERERLFYTRQNGILIDNIRLAIEKRYAGSDLVSRKKKNLLLALLLVEASTRANTNGVFKGFHQGFGGLSHYALSRILRPVALAEPSLLPKTEKRHKVFKSDALKLAKKLSGLEAEIAYLDPPYNQPQYGSNYHLLNTVARNDRPAVSKSFWIDGKKTDKSAIRKDWVKTRSAFCYKESAL